MKDHKESAPKAPLRLGTKTRYGEIAAVGTRNGERFYMMIDKHKSVTLMPGDLSIINDALPAVGGRRLDCSVATYERRALLALKTEQEKIAPDNALIAVLCDAVRLGREYCDAMQGPQDASIDSNSATAASGSQGDMSGGGRKA